MRSLLIPFALGALALPASAKDSLGVYSNWAAFRDAETPRCYAIAKPRGEQKRGSYVSVATWPSQRIRNQVHVRLAAPAGANGSARLRVGRQNFSLLTSGRDAWASDAKMDAAIVAALRSANSMSVSARSAGGRRFIDRYDLAGVATAMDAATVGCAGLG
ncbi:MAG: invasion associated locus B family protein [Pseudomonadota bacterium]